MCWRVTCLIANTTLLFTVPKKVINMGQIENGRKLKYMNKINMIKEIASEAEVTNKVAEAVVDAYGKFVLESLNENHDEKVPLPGLGLFSVKHVAERSGVAALAGGKEWTKPAHDELKFTISKSAKQI